MVRHILCINETNLPSSKPPSLACSTSTTRLGWSCGAGTGVNCEPPQSVNSICGWRQAAAKLISDQWGYTNVKFSQKF